MMNDTIRALSEDAAAYTDSSTCSRAGSRLFQFCENEVDQLGIQVPVIENKLMPQHCPFSDYLREDKNQVPGGQVDLNYQVQEHIRTIRFSEAEKRKPQSA